MPDLLKMAYFSNIMEFNQDALSFLLVKEIEKLDSKFVEEIADKIDSLKKAKETDISNKISNWPRDKEEYRKCINNIANVGKSSPKKAIEFLSQIFRVLQNDPNDNPHILYEMLKQKYGIANTDMKLFVFDFLMYFIFADTVAQIITFIDKENENFYSTLKSLCFGFIQIHYNFDGYNNLQLLIDSWKQKILNKCSVIMYYISKDHFGYNIAIAELDSIKSDGILKNNIMALLLFRFFIHKPESVMAFINSQILPIIQITKDKNDLVILYDILKCVMLQIPYGSEETDQLITLFESKVANNVLKSKIFEYKAILSAISPNTNINIIHTLMKSLANSQEEVSLLKGFLYLLRGTSLISENDIWEFGEYDYWEFGEINKNYDIFKELKQNSKIETNEKFNPSKINFDSFSGLFLKYIASKIQDNSTSLKIILHLFSRNFQCASESLISNYTKLHSPIILLKSLLIIFNNKQQIIQKGIILEESFLSGEEVINKMVINYLNSYKLSDNIKTYLCKNLNLSEVSYSLNPSDSFPDELSNNFLLIQTQKINEAEKILSKIPELPKRFLNSSKIEIISCNQADNHTTTELIYFISLFCLNQNSIDKSIINKILRICICDSKENAFFALYAIQFLYYTYDYLVVPILEGINHIIYEIISQPQAFTYLYLLHRLLTIKKPSIFENGFELQAIKNWFIQLQSILLAHLTSQYNHIRNIALLLMRQLDLMNLTEYSLFFILSKYDRKITKRVQKFLGIELIQNQINFEVVALSSNTELYQYFLSEFSQSILRSNFSEVITQFLELKLYKNIKYDSNSICQNLQIISMCFRLLPLNKELSTKIENNIDVFKENNSLFIYEIGKDNLLASDELTNDFLNYHKDALDKILKNIRNELNPEIDAYIKCIAHSSSSAIISNSVSNIISKLNKIMKNESKIVENETNIINLLTFIRYILESPEFSITFKADNQFSDIILNNFFSLIGKLLYNFYCQNVDNIKLYQIGILSSSCIILISKLIGKEIQYSMENILDILIKVGQKLLNDESNRIFQNKLNLAITSIIDKFKIFNDVSNRIEINDKILLILNYLLEIEYKDKEQNCLIVFLTHYPQFLKWFIDQCFVENSDKFFLLFRALSGLIHHYSLDEWITNNLLTNYAIDFSGDIIILSLTFLGSANKEYKKIALSILKKIIKILHTIHYKFYKQNSKNTGNFESTYQNQIEYIDQIKLLFMNETHPTQKQCFDFTVHAFNNMEFIIQPVFSSFKERFLAILKQSEFTFSSFLNIISAFSRQLTINSNKSVFYPFLSIDQNKPVMKSSNISSYQFLIILLNFLKYISHNNHLLQSYYHIFEEICYNSSNIHNLLSYLLVFASDPSQDEDYHNICKGIFHYFVYKLPSYVIPMLCQRFAFGFWFYQNIRNSKENKTITVFDKWKSFSIVLILNIVKNNISIFLPYAHFILNYCLLFYDDVEAKELIHAIFILLDLNIFTLENESITLSNIDLFSKANSSQIQYIIKLICEKLQQIYPSAIYSWRNEAYQWATSCSDLKVAINSGIMYSQLTSYILNSNKKQTEEFNSSTSKQTIGLIKAINVVLNEYQLTIKSNNQIFDYFSICLTALENNIKSAFKFDSSSVIPDIFILLSNFITFGYYNNSDEITTKSIQIMQLYFENGFIFDSKEIFSNLVQDISKIIPKFFNSSLIPNFLASLIHNLSIKNDEDSKYSMNYKIISFVLLVLIFRIEDSRRQFSIFNSSLQFDQFYSQLTDLINSFQGSDFDLKSNYCKILRDYLHNKDKAVDFISLLMNEIIKSNSESFSDIIRVLTILASNSQNNIELINCIFDLLLSLIKSTNRSSAILSTGDFSQILEIVYTMDTKSSKALLSGLIQNDIFINIENVVQGLNLEQNNNFLLSKVQNLLNNQDVPTTIFDVNGGIPNFPVLMIFSKPKDQDTQQSNLHNVKYEPYFSYEELINKKEKEIPESLITHYKEKDGSVDLDSPNIITSLHINDELFNPNHFIINDHDLEMFI